MTRDYLTTSQIARAAGVHPNTVRLYEEWGFLPPVERTPKGYRRFTQAHLNQMRLARLTLHGGWPGKLIRQSALALVRQSAAGDLAGALAAAHNHLRLVQAERAQADAAAEVLEQWAKSSFPGQVHRSGNLSKSGAPDLSPSQPDNWHLGRTAAARLLEVTPEVLRNWERNGLIHVPRAHATGYRLYGPQEINRLRIIRLLSRSGYSTMAILRMLLHLDRGGQGDLRQVLDTPRPDEDVLTAADAWLSTLTEQEQRARAMIELLEDMNA